MKNDRRRKPAGSVIVRDVQQRCVLKSRGHEFDISIDARSLRTVVRLEDKDSARLQKVRAAIAGAIVPMTLT
jgi:hypothetical protein